MARGRRPRGTGTGRLSAVLREATSADVAAIAHLHAESWRATYRGAYPDQYLDGPVYADREDVWRDRFASQRADQHVVVAEDDGQLVGFACVFGDDDATYGALLDNLHVRPGLHRSGIGRRLVEEVARWTVATRPGRGLYLWVLSQNTNARGFYSRLGGEDAGAKDAHPPVEGPAIEARRIVWTDPASLVPDA